MLSSFYLKRTIMVKYFVVVVGALFVLEWLFLEKVGGKQMLSLSLSPWDPWKWWEIDRQRQTMDEVFRERKCVRRNFDNKTIKIMRILRGGPHWDRWINRLHTKWKKGGNLISQMFVEREGNHSNTPVCTKSFYHKNVKFI